MNKRLQTQNQAKNLEFLKQVRYDLDIFSNVTILVVRETSKQWLKIWRS